jgi:O-acetyl-ADP-ribose deacetylase (regulator of RNase III)
VTIEIVQGDLFESGCEAIVNTVNTVGTMGKGLAEAFKARYPANFIAYEAACERREIRTGRMFITEHLDMFGPRWLINFPTKQHWSYPSKMVWIESGLADLAVTITRLHIGSVAVPALGCSNGGLRWSDVHPRIVAALEHLPACNVRVYPPQR